MSDFVDLNSPNIPDLIDECHLQLGEEVDLLLAALKTGRLHEARLHHVRSRELVDSLELLTELAFNNASARKPALRG